MRVALLLALAACGCPRPGAGPVDYVGVPPSGADVVVEVARERCDFAGTVTWVDGPFACYYSAEPVCSGWQRGPRCGPLDAWVTRREPATSSALAWEIGNYCLDDEDGPAVAAWSEAVNAEAARRLAGGT